MRRWTESLRLGDHVLHPYRDAVEQERAVMDVFNWTPEGAKMYYFSSRPGLGSVLSVGSELGDRLGAARREGRLVMLDAESYYRPEGAFRHLPLLEAVERATEEARSEGFSSMVAVGDVRWLGMRAEHFSEFVRYEAMVTFLDLPLPAAFVCQYDRSLFSPQQIEQMRVFHDQVLIDRVLERSCWIIPRHRPMQRQPQ